VKIPADAAVSKGPTAARVVRFCGEAFPPSDSLLRQIVMTITAYISRYPRHSFYSFLLLSRGCFDRDARIL
jgi:hypothetical protein